MPGIPGPALPGFILWIAGTVLQRNPPFSVCHQVSTITASPLPTIWWYHFHTAGSIGSPTVVMCLKWWLYFAGSSGPSRRSARIAVGDVWKMLTPRFSAIRQGRPASGWVGTPSYTTDDAASDSGP